MFSLKKILYFEDRYAMVEINSAELQVLLKEVEQLAKKFDNVFLYVNERQLKNSEKIKVVTTEYILSGMGNLSGEIEKLRQ